MAGGVAVVRTGAPPRRPPFPAAPRSPTPPFEARSVLWWGAAGRRKDAPSWTKRNKRGVKKKQIYTPPRAKKNRGARAQRKRWKQHTHNTHTLAHRALCSPPHPSTPAPADATMTATVAPWAATRHRIMDWDSFWLP